MSEKGLLAKTEHNNKTYRRPTARGESIGIYTEERSGKHGDYVGVLYNEEAQRYIVDNIGAIIAFCNREKS